ncbi:hypothetical protein CHELA20_10622 [Hyphomicrobiales bacterium]|nr:hypothetical protein CHELA20_10622 [Hyphomicrobiales bacterium]CAH1693011.1 hypothetical protein CHELA41_50851 [Hyphomicrobiales bacterium]
MLTRHLLERFAYNHRILGVRPGKL